MHYSYLQLTNFRVHFPEIMHHTVKIEFTSTENHVFSRFLYLWSA